ncbi:unnamed protein product [Ambrosiozyma monospora]|uniref:Unnamed protein product n=1 Tax=Ambrosiozyma monospora TaxID=43982 RepID=A0A9W6YQM8_AMBMO|nr:unnamed protein product [Ambrosiozyma monospora]
MIHFIREQYCKKIKTPTRINIHKYKAIYELKAPSENQLDSFDSNYYDNTQLYYQEYIPTSETTTPFVRLLQGEEPINNLELRYELYNTNWTIQRNLINDILSKSEKDRFQKLVNFLYLQPSIKKTNKGKNRSKKAQNPDSIKWFFNQELESNCRLKTVLLRLGSNISNHPALLNNVFDNLNAFGEDEKTNKSDIFVVRLNSKFCNNDLDTTVKIIVSKLHDKLDEQEVVDSDEEMVSSSDDEGKSEDEEKDKDGSDSDSDDEYEKDEENQDEFDSDDEESQIHRRNILEDYQHHNVSRKAKVRNLDLQTVFLELLSSNEDVKITLLIEDADSFQSSLISQLVNLLWTYSKDLQINIQIILGVSTPTVMFQEKIPKLTLAKLKVMAFDADNSDKIIEEIMENLLLNINDTYNSLIFEPKLVMKFLQMRSNIGISQFYNYMKLIYMKHYFSQPLSVFWTQELHKVEMHNNYYEVFKRLPSVLNHQTSNDDEISQLYEAFSEDGKIDIVRQLLKKNLLKLIHWRYDLRSLIEFLNLLQNHFSSLMSDKTDKTFSSKHKLWDNNLQLFLQLFKTDNEDTTYAALETQDESELRNRFAFLNPIWNQLRQCCLDADADTDSETGNGNGNRFKPANDFIATLKS